MVRSGCVALLLLATVAVHADSKARELDWLELMPKDEVKALTEAPGVEHKGMFKAQQQGSARVVKELDGSKVRIAGYIVPVEVADQKMTEFFIVPYFGACIHVPPPPPNQIILARLAKPVPVTDIYDAYWVEGTLEVEATKNDVAASSYVLVTDKVTLWE